MCTSCLDCEAPPLFVAGQESPPVELLSQHVVLLPQILNGLLLLLREPAGHHRHKQGQDCWMHSGRKREVIGIMAFAPLGKLASLGEDHLHVDSLARRSSEDYDGDREKAMRLAALIVFGLVASAPGQELVSIEIVGPTQIADDSTTQFMCRAHFDDGSSADVTALANWSVMPDDTAAVDMGVLTVDDLEGPLDLVVSTSYTFGDSTETDDAGVSVIQLSLTQEDKLYAFDPQAQDSFGSSVLISDLFYVVGAPRFNDDQGALYVVDRATGEQIKLVAGDGEPEDRMRAVAIGEGLIAAGAGYDDVDGVENIGSVYFFDPETGEETGRLYSPDGDEHDLFGISLAIGDGYLAVGSFGANVDGVNRGALYLFDLETLELVRKIATTESDVFGFGVALSIRDGLVAVAATTSNTLGVFDSGAAFLYDIETGRQVTRFNPPLPMEEAYFGAWLTFADDFMVMGAPGEDVDGVDSVGAAYVFDMEGAMVSRLLAKDGTTLDRFGAGIAYDDGLIAIGAAGDSEVEDYAGSVYLFNLAPGQQHLKQPAPIAVDRLRFGSALDMEGDLLLVGAYGDDDQADRAGAVFEYSIDVVGVCKADVNGDGNLDVLDFVTFQQLWQSGQVAADCDGDGGFTILDFICYQQLFVAGCG